MAQGMGTDFFDQSGFAGCRLDGFVDYAGTDMVPPDGVAAGVPGQGTRRKHILPAPRLSQRFYICVPARGADKRRRILRDRILAVSSRVKTTGMFIFLLARTALIASFRFCLSTFRLLNIDISKGIRF
jgi:hypothetical protein